MSLSQTSSPPSHTHNCSVDPMVCIFSEKPLYNQTVDGWFKVVSPPPPWRPPAGSYRFSPHETDRRDECLPPPTTRIPDRVKLGIRGWGRMIGSRRGSPPVEIFTPGTLARSLRLTVPLSSLSPACQKWRRRVGDKFKIPDKWARSDEEWRLRRWWGDIIKLPPLLVGGWGARRQIGERERDRERRHFQSTLLFILFPPSKCAAPPFCSHFTHRLESLPINWRGKDEK